MRKLILTSILLTSILSAQAEEAWGLEATIRYALEQNISLKNIRIQRENAQLSLQTARLSRLPDLNASIGESFDFGRSPNREGLIQDRNSANTSFSLNSNVALFTGLRTQNQIKANQFAIYALTEDLQKASDDLALQVTGLFMQILYNEEMHHVAQEQLTLSEEQVVRTEQLVTSGRLAESELHEARAALAKNRQSVVEARNSVQLSTLDLAQALEVEDTQSFRIQTPPIDGALIEAAAQLESRGAILLNQLPDRPALRAAAWRIEQGRKQVNIAKSAYFPTLSFGAFYSNGYYHVYGSEFSDQNVALGEQLKTNSRYGLGLSLNIPIFNRLSTRNQVRSARLDVESRQLTLLQTRKDLRKEIEQAYYNAQAARERFAAAHEAMGASQTAYDFAAKRYESGKLTAYEFNEVKLRLAQTAVQLSQSKYEFVFRSKIIDFYLGVPIRL